MIQGVGRGGALAQAAIEAALRSHAEATRRIDQLVADATPKAPAALDGARAGDGIAKATSALADGLRAVESRVKQVEELPLDLVTGKVTDFHEIAGRVKSAELAFRFSLEVRNKLIDAYRETMRMSV